MAKKAKAVVAPVVVDEVITEMVPEVVVDEVITEMVPEVVVDEVITEMVPEVVVESELTAQLKAVITNPAPVIKLERNEGVGAFIKKRIAEGLGNKEILPLVHEAFGNEKTTYACVAWYRNKMKKSGTTKKLSAAEIIEQFLSRNEELIPAEEVACVRENLSRMAG